MPVSRDANGNIIDKPTEQVGRSTHDRPTEIEPGRRPTPGAARPAGRAGDDIPTKIDSSLRARQDSAPGGGSGYDAPDRAGEKESAPGDR